MSLECAQGFNACAHCNLCSSSAGGRVPEFASQCGALHLRQMWKNVVNYMMSTIIQHKEDNLALVSKLTSIIAKDKHSIHKSFSLLLQFLYKRKMQADNLVAQGIFVNQQSSFKSKQNNDKESKSSNGKACRKK